MIDPATLTEADVRAWLRMHAEEIKARYGAEDAVVGIYEHTEGVMTDAIVHAGPVCRWGQSVASAADQIGRDSRQSDSRVQPAPIAELRPILST